MLLRLFLVFTLISVGKFQLANAFIPRFSVFGYEVDLLELFPGLLLNSRSCFANNFYSERSNTPLARRSDYAELKVPSDEIISTVRIHSQGPLSLQGIFWVQVPPGSTFEISSFAPTTEGGGLSTGVLDDSNTPAYRLRQFGDRVRMAEPLALPVSLCAHNADLDDGQSSRFRHFILFGRYYARLVALGRNR